MKAVILAGGLGTRISEESHLKPKPMIEIGGLPILWHIMKIYSSHGINDFIICSGYKGYMIKEYFANYFLHTSDITFDLQKNSLELHSSRTENWRVTIVDTGLDTMTGGRMKRVRSFLGDQDFCMTYGDGVGNVNISELVRFHQSKNRLATVTALRPPGRFGHISLKDQMITGFVEKPDGENTWINGGFFVLNPRVLDEIQGDDTVWERGPMESLAAQGQMSAYVHQGFWQPMDTLRDKNMLEDLWRTGKAPWKIW
ncbi:MAG: glucose-1-phosphate cytidylyltransferase [Bdellovibrionaceae bacterium]|nr:glucose-1-phosphate cytidylyltransferase [Pseudobdellovibrionaceae bacterium]